MIDGSQEINPFTGNDAIPVRKELQPSRPLRILYPPDDLQACERDREVLQMIRGKMDTLTNELRTTVRSAGKDHSGIHYILPGNPDAEISVGSGERINIRLTTERFKDIHAVTQGISVSFANAIMTLRDESLGRDAYELIVPMVADMNWYQQTREYAQNNPGFARPHVETCYQLDGDLHIVKKISGNAIRKISHRNPVVPTNVNDPTYMEAALGELLTRVNPQKYPPPSGLQPKEDNDEPFTG